MQLLILLAVLLCVSLAEAAPAEPAGRPLGGALLVAASMSLTIAAAAIFSWSALRALNRGHAWGDVCRQLGRAQMVHAVLWLGASVAALHFGHWPQIVRYNWGLGEAVLVDDLLILSPLLFSLLAAWATWHAVDRHLAVLATAKHSASKVKSSRCPTTLQAVGLHARHYLVLPLAPLLLMLGAEDFGRLVAPAESEGWKAVALLPPLVLLAAFFPVLLRHLWSTQPLAGGLLRERLESLARAWGVVPREILVWNTHRQILNAAVAGFLPRWRYVFLSDALIEHFDAAEVEAVFAHELAHIRSRHMLKRTLVLILPVVLWLAVRQMLPSVVAAAGQWLDACGLTTALQGAVLFPLAMGVYFTLVFAPYSRLLEHEADLAACGRRVPCGKIAGSVSSESVEQFCVVLEKLGAGMGRRTRSLLHPSVDERIGLLRQCLVEPAAATRLFRRTAVANRLSASLASGSLAAACLSLWPPLTGL